MNWDPFQREALEALGHRLYRIGGAGDPVSSEVRLAPGRLHDALLRAAGVARLPEGSRLLDTLWDGSPLPTPSARRALWPALRALRRQGG